jgi:hypothetical protein
MYFRKILLGMLWAAVGLTASSQTLENLLPKISESTDNATWYYIRNGKGGYLSAAYDYKTTDGNFSLSNTIQPTDDNGQWCVTGNATGGYKIYNKQSKQVLGVTSTGNATAVLLYDESTSDGVTLTFDFTESTCSSDYPFYCMMAPHGSSSACNYYNSVLKLWSDGTGYPTDAGNGWTFIEADNVDNVEAVRTAYVELKTFVEDNNARPYYFYDKEKAGALLTKYTYTNNLDFSATTMDTEIENDLSTFKGENTIDKNGAVTMDVTNGMNVFVGNLDYSDKYVYARSGNTDLGYTDSQTWNTVLRIYDTGEGGPYKFYLPYLEKYVGALPSWNNTRISLVDNADNAGLWAFVQLDGETEGYCAIAAVSPTMHEQYYYWHEAGWDGLVRWEANGVNPSHFNFISAEDWITTQCMTLQNTITACFEGDKIGYMTESDALKTARENLSTTQSVENYCALEKCYANWVKAQCTALQNTVDKCGYGDKIGYMTESDALKAAREAISTTQSVENFRTLETLYDAALIRPEATKLYRIRNAKGSNNEVLYEKYDEPKTDGSTDYKLYCDANTTAAALWQLEACTYTPVYWDAGLSNVSGYRIKCANSGKYVSPTHWLYYDVNMLDDSGSAGIYDLFYHRSVETDGAVNLLDRVHEGTMQVGVQSQNTDTPTGYLGSWNDPGAETDFFIEEATELPVNLHAAADGSGYATLLLRFAVELPEGVTAYYGKDEGDYVTLTAIEDNILPAATPAILVGTPGAHTLTISYAAATAPEDNSFAGVYAPAEVEGYILTQKDDLMGFYRLTTDKTLSANKAYLPSTTEQSAKALRFGDAAGETTGIDAVTPTTLPTVLYDLGGHRVTHPVRGIYVTAAGEKIFVK